jgi:ribosomal protein S18 acetylase RimI-like enzyme
VTDPDPYPDGEERIRVMDSAEFAPYVARAADVYGAAMGRGPDLVAQRHSIIAGHLNRDEFVAVTAMRAGDLTGFAYGYRGRPGDWWHDVVTSALDRPAARRWMDDDFEIAELHVHPLRQGRGLGRVILQTLLDSSSSRTAVLSTHDHDSPARALYRSFGFTDLLRDFRFPGSAEVYAILGLER